MRVAVLFLLALLSGCSVSAANRAELAREQKQEKEKLARANTPGALYGEGFHIEWRTPQIQHPDQPQRLFTASASSASVTMKEKNLIFDLKQAHGTIYKKNAPAYAFTAGMVYADRAAASVKAENGVYFTSVGKSPAIQVSAERAYWNHARNILVAEGNVHAQYQKNGQTFRPFSTKMTYHFDTGQLDY